MPDERTTYLCPHCRAAMAAPASGESIVRCPACDHQVVLTTDLEGREAEVDGRRIQQLAASRRAAMRVQTYFYVAAVGCVAAAAECVYKACYTGRWNVTRVLLVAMAICSVLGTVYFLRHAVSVARELRKPLLNEPTIPPDFSNLGDGSQRVKDLENLSDQR